MFSSFKFWINLNTWVLIWSNSSEVVLVYMEINLRISIVNMMFFQIYRGTKDHTLRFGNIKGEFITYQVWSLFRSELTASFISAIDFDENEMPVSSAYIVTFVLSSGPRHDPWRTPQFSFAIFDVCPFTLQHWLQSCRYDLYQTSFLPSLRND